MITGFQWLVAGGTLSAFVLAGLAFRLLLFTVVKRWFDRTETKVDDILLESCRYHVPAWFLLIGLQAAESPLGLPAHARVTAHKLLVILWGLSLTLWAAQVLGDIVEYYAGRLQGTRTTSSLSINGARAMVVALGALLVLSNLGISIAPLITALGVGSLAVALALQDTLSNIFAGFYILINRQIRPGDYVRLDSGQEGHVMDVGWRTTRLHEPSNDIVIVPNSKLGQAIVTNFHLPELEFSFPVPVGVGYGSDLDRVEGVALEVAGEVQRSVEGAVPGFVPALRYQSFGDSSVNFVVVLRVRQFVDRALLIHEFIKRLHKRFARENIEIPFPQRVVHLEKNSTSH